MILQCAKCPSTLGSDKPGRLKHHADGSHTVVYLVPRKAVTDPKPRGRRRG